MASKEKTVGRLNIRIGMNLDDFNKKMRQFQREVRKAERSLQGFKILGRQLKSIGSNLTASLTVPIVGVGVAAKKSFDIVDEALDTIAISSGATGKELENLHKSFMKVGREVPNDLREIGQIIGDLNTYLGVTGPILEELTKQLALAARMLNEDVGNATRSVSRAINKWGIDVRNASKFMNQLFAASQRFGISMTKLADQLAYFQVPLKQMGFDIVEATVILGEFERMGVSAEQVLRSLFRGIANFAQAGITDTAGAFNTMIRLIKEAKTESEAAAIAIKAFGTRAGPQLAAEIRAGRFEIEELVKEFRDIGRVIDQTFAETADSAEILAAAKNTLTLALEPLGREIDKLARVLLPPLIKAIARLTESFDKLSQPAKTATVLILAFVAAIGPIMTVAGYAVQGITQLVAAFTALKTLGWVGLLNNLRAFTIGLLKNIVAVGLLVGAISSLIYMIVKWWNEGYPDDVDTFWERFQWNFKNLGEGFIYPFKWMVDQFKGLFDDLAEAEVALFENSLKRYSDVEKNAEVDLSKLLGDDKNLKDTAAEKGKTAGEVFAEAFRKVWDELWEKPYNLGKLDTLEKQLNQLKYISEQAENRIKQAMLAEGVEIADDIWSQTVESSQAFAQIWDKIFVTQKEITEQQIELIKAQGLTPENISKINNLIEQLKPVAKTSQAKLTVEAMRSEFIATTISEEFSKALGDFERQLDIDLKTQNFADQVDALRYERYLFEVEMGEVLSELKNIALVTLGTTETPEIKAVEKAIQDRIARLDEDIRVAEVVRAREADEKLAEILQRVSQLSREELQKYWDEALRLAIYSTAKTSEIREEINKLFEKRDAELRLEEWFTALEDIADVIGKFNAEAGQTVHNFRDIIGIFHRLPEIAQNIQLSFSEMHENINKAFEPYLGKNYVGQLFGAAAGLQMFGRSPTGEMNWVGAIAGTLAGAGIAPMITGAIAAGSQLVNALFPGKEKDPGAEALKEQIDNYNKILEEWGASYRSENVSFKKDAGFLGWRNLFGNVKWETLNEEAAKQGAEIAERIIASMQSVFQSMAGGVFDALFGFGGLESLSKSVGQSLQNALMEAILNTAAIKEPMQQLSAYIAEAVQDGLTSAELEHIRNMTGEIWNRLEPYEDIAKEIAEQFGLAEDSARGIAQSLRNVPQGFKIALERFTAATGIQTNGMTTTLEANHTQIIFEGPVYGMDDFERKVEAAVDKSERRRRVRNYGVWAKGGAY